MSLSDFCPSSVPKDASAELVKLYSCKDAANCFLQVNQENYKRTQYNDTQKKKLQDSRNTWNQNRASYEARLDSWNKRIGEFSKFAKYDGKSHDFWAVDQDGTCWGGENWNEAHKWCHWMGDRKGYDGENYWAKEWGWCYGRYGNFKCKKDDNTVKYQQAEYEASKPIFTEKEPIQDDFPLLPLLPLDNINIQCCSNYMSGDASFVGNEQSCVQSIEKKIIDITGSPSIPTSIPSAPAPSPSPTSPSAPSTTVPSTIPEKVPSKSNSLALFGILILIIVVILCSSALALFILDK